LFQIGSTTKTMTATAMMRLVQDGLVDLDQPVQTYLPTFWLEDQAVAQAVTVRHLLNHTAGWVGDLFTNTGDGDDALERYVELVGKQKQITPLGEVWHYNNAAFGVAGRIIEVISQKPFEAALEELLLKPLGLHKSCFFPHQAMLERFAVGHYLDDQKQLQVSRPWALARAIAPIGRINSSLREQLHYAKFCLHGNSDVLHHDLRLEMQRPAVRGQLGDWFGIGWWLNDATGQMVVSHGGATNGQMSAFWFIPSLGVACTILTNAEKGRYFNTEVSGFIQRELLGLQAPQAVVQNHSAAQLEPYLGDYVAHAFGTRLKVYLEHQDLMLQVIPGDTSSVTTTPAPPLPPMKCVLLENETLRIEEGDSKGGRGEFLDNRRWLRLSGRVYERQQH
jgi:CubicO group peptidase (beta-lactamase class C family)